MTQDEIRIAIKTIVDHFDQEDRAVRDRQIRQWRRLKLYWDGFHKIWYSEVAHDWRIYDYDKDDNDDASNDHYDKPVNVFRAYLESIIAALSITIPKVKCFPDDATNDLDLSTAKTGSHIAELLYKHNNADLTWLHALYVYCTEGLVAAYNYSKTDKSFGTYEKKHYSETTEPHYVCPECETEVDSLFIGDQQQVELICPECGNQIDPNLEQQPFTISRLDKVTDEPKTRQCIEVYGGLYVKVPNYAMSQEECPYLIYSYETHFANAIDKFEELRDIKDWSTRTGYDAGGIYDPYERWGRLNPQYQGEYPTNTVTIRNCWFRPSAYNILKDEEADQFRSLFPDGVKVILVNEEIAEDPIMESMDDHWTLTKNPLSDHLHHDPLGLLPIILLVELIPNQ